MDTWTPPGVWLHDESKLGIPHMLINDASPVGLHVRAFSESFWGIFCKRVDLLETSLKR